MFITMCGTEVATLGGLEDPSVFRTPPTPQTISAERHSGPQPTLYLACGPVHWSTAKMFELARENVEPHIV